MIKQPRSPYRWVILGVFMLLNVVIQMQWLAHAAVARPAEVFYQGQFNPDSLFNIDFLAIIYMLVYIVMSIPASYILDTYGIRWGLGIGAVLTAVFGILKGVAASSFTGVVIAQVGFAVAQPFVLNAVTAVTVRWFPMTERGMAAGFSALSQYLGIIIAMLVTPLFIGADPSQPGYGGGFEKMLRIYGFITITAAILSLLFIRERPKVAPGDEEQIRPAFLPGLKQIVSNRDMRITLLLFFIGLGIFNAVSSMTDSIAEKLGVEDSDGMIGGIMLVGGILGALIIPILSDRFRKRKLFLVICMIGMVPGIAGITFAGSLSSDTGTIYTIALAGSFLLGFFVMSAGPVGFQYAAEISYPAPESTSQGLLLWVGQITGMIFVAGMSLHSNTYLHLFMILFSALSLVTLLLVTLLRESPRVRTAL